LSRKRKPARPQATIAPGGPLSHAFVVSPWPSCAKSIFGRSGRLASAAALLNAPSGEERPPLFRWPVRVKKMRKIEKLERVFGSWGSKNAPAPDARRAIYSVPARLAMREERWDGGKGSGARFISRLCGGNPGCSMGRRRRRAKTPRIVKGQGAALKR
jgi:hypothetical protein